MNIGNSNQEGGYPRTSPRGSYAHSDSKDWHYYYSVILNNWYWVALGLAAGLAAFYINLRYSKTTYLVGGSVLIEDVEQKPLTKEAVLDDLGSQTAKTPPAVEDRMRILGSTELMARIVDSLDLNVHYSQEGKVKETEVWGDVPLQLLYWNTEGAEKAFTLKVRHYDATRFLLYRDDEKTELMTYGTPFKFGKRELVLKRTGPLTDQTPTVIRVADEYATAADYAAKLNIQQAGRSNILGVSMIDEVPDRAIAIINRLVREYGGMSMESKNIAGRRTMEFIEQRLRFVANELYSVEKQEEGFRVDNRLPMITSDVAKNLVEKSNAVEQKMVGLDERMTFIRTIENTIATSTGAGQYTPLPFSSEVLGNVPLAGLIKEHNELITRRNQMKESATEGNPILKTSDEELRSLRNNILISIQAIKEEVNEQKERYTQQMAPIESQMNMMPATERQLTTIMREKNIKETLFLYLLQKREETALNVAAQVPNSRLLERATLRGKVSPKPMQLAIFWILLGLALPLLTIYLKDLLKDRVLYRFDLDRHLSLPFVGFIPHSADKRSRLIINDSRSVLAESFRLVRSNLQNTAGAASQHRAILVTSTVSGEGKTFVAANLGTTFALTGKRVIVIGLDLRKPKLAKYLTGQQAEHGVSQYLAGSGKISDIIQTWDRLPNLHFIDCGDIPKNPAELMMTDRLRELFEHCERNYDYVLVDAAPVGVVADAFLLKEFISQTLVIFRYNFSRSAHLKFIDEVAQGNKLPNMNSLLNDVRQERGNSYNYGYYSSNYYQEEQPGLLGKIKKLVGIKAD